MARLTRGEAHSIKHAANIPEGTEFHALNGDQVSKLLDFADMYKYRQPKHANGSRARYFYAYVDRTARKEVR